ncbi:homeodomain superfamily [Paramecium bursaria]
MPIRIEQYENQRRQMFLTKINTLYTSISKFLQTQEQNVQNNPQEDPNLVQKAIQLQNFIIQVRDQVLDENLLTFQTQAQLNESLDYMDQILSNEIKVYQQMIQLKNNDYEERKGHKFTKKANLLLKHWLYKHFSYPYPTQEQTLQLAQKCQLSYKQIQIWFINARGRIQSKSYNKMKFKNLVKERFLSQLHS